MINFFRTCQANWRGDSIMLLLTLAVQHSISVQEKWNSRKNLKYDIILTPQISQSTQFSYLKSSLINITVQAGIFLKKGKRVFCVCWWKSIYTISSFHGQDVFSSQKQHVLASGQLCQYYSTQMQRTWMGAGPEPPPLHPADLSEVPSRFKLWKAVCYLKDRSE